MTKKYIGYKERILFFTTLSILFSIISIILITGVLSVNKTKLVSYQENGNLDYNVYLKPNEFYDNEYLEKDMVYIASLIKNIDVDVNYDFIISEKEDIDFTYQVLGKLSVYNDSKTSVLFEKEYTLLDTKRITEEEIKTKKINEKINIDYDYYNNLANSFKSTYGVESESDLTIYVKINKVIDGININENSQMSLTIPLTQKTINIQINNENINAVRNIISDEKLSFLDGVLIFFLAISILAIIVSLFHLLKLLLLLRTKKSKYDKYVERLLIEYDRLIVETSTTPDFIKKKIIKIEKFQELLDLRDSMNKPIMYHNLVKHHKCYFYVDQFNTCYLHVVKASDMEDSNDK